MVTIFGNYTEKFTWQFFKNKNKSVLKLAAVSDNTAPFENRNKSPPLTQVTADVTS